MAENKLTAQQRAQLFGAATRQHFQMIGKKSVGPSQTVEFAVPKARIVEGFRLRMKGAVTGGTLIPGSYDIYDLIRRISVDFNNGFSPVVVSGAQMARINTLSPAAKLIPATNPEMAAMGVGGLCVVDGANFDFMLDIPLVLNYRDPVGLVLAQNQETNITVTIDTANPANVIEGATDFSATVELECNSFSIPANTNYLPDMSVLKVVDARNEVFTAGQNYIKLPVGMIYRKMVFKFENADGEPMTAEEITSNIELVLNTADIPYSISPDMLKKFNIMQVGMDMGAGVYFFSFDWQGLAASYGGSRDLLDTERITEFALRFSASVPGKVTIVSEKMSRLIAG
ncbi:MAG: cytoplasmic protein [Clostridia bacterium]|nr:cytoplasmic protein [Clostridia bacterium]